VVGEALRAKYRIAPRRCKMRGQFAVKSLSSRGKARALKCDRAGWR
jgi:hypothetical protein